MCDRLTTKKYSSRPGPPYAANKCAEHTRKRGNDGLMYVARADIHGVNRWVKCSSTKRRVPTKRPKTKSKSKSKRRVPTKRPKTKSKSKSKRRVPTKRPSTKRRRTKSKSKSKTKTKRRLTRTGRRMTADVYYARLPASLKNKKYPRKPTGIAQMPRAELEKRCVAMRNLWERKTGKNYDLGVVKDFSLAKLRSELADFWLPSFVQTFNWIP